MEGRRRRRVVESHRIASAALRLAAVFAGVAIGWSAWVVIAGGSWWGPVHAALAGTVLLAISGTAQMFTVTWAAAPSPSHWLAVTQRWSVVVGVAAVLVGVEVGIEWLAGTGAAAILLGLVLLAISLVGAVRRSLLRRFDLSSRFYLLGIACGGLGVALGGLIATGLVSSGEVVAVHAHLNIVGLIGFTITGTLPTFLPTLARHRAVSGAEALAALVLAGLSALAIAAGLLWGPTSIATGVALAGLSMALVLAGALWRLGRQGAGTGGLAYAHVATGCVWLVVWSVVDAAGLALDGAGPVLSEWTGAAVVAGIGQVLAGSIAYLVPVLAGPPPRLGRNLARMARHPWLPLAAGNLAGVALVFGAGAAAVGSGLVWAADIGRRLAGLEWSGPADQEAAS